MCVKASELDARVGKPPRSTCCYCFGTFWIVVGGVFVLLGLLAFGGAGNPPWAEIVTVYYAPGSGPSTSSSIAMCNSAQVTQHFADGSSTESYYCAFDAPVLCPYSSRTSSSSGLRWYYTRSSRLTSYDSDSGRSGGSIGGSCVGLAPRPPARPKITDFGPPGFSSNPAFVALSIISTLLSVLALLVVAVSWEMFDGLRASAARWFADGPSEEEAAKASPQSPAAAKVAARARLRAFALLFMLQILVIAFSSSAVSPSSNISALRYNSLSSQRSSANAAAYVNAAQVFDATEGGPLGLMIGTIIVSSCFIATAFVFIFFRKSCHAGCCTYGPLFGEDEFDASLAAGRVAAAQAQLARAQEEYMRSRGWVPPPGWASNAALQQHGVMQMQQAQYAQAHVQMSEPGVVRVQNALPPAEQAAILARLRAGQAQAAFPGGAEFPSGYPGGGLPGGAGFVNGGTYPPPWQLTSGQPQQWQPQPFQVYPQPQPWQPQQLRQPNAAEFGGDSTPLADPNAVPPGLRAVAVAGAGAGAGAGEDPADDPSPMAGRGRAAAGAGAQPPSAWGAQAQAWPDAPPGIAGAGAGPAAASRNSFVPSKFAV
jgi:hypothetical protein